MSTSSYYKNKLSLSSILQTDDKKPFNMVIRPCATSSQGVNAKQQSATRARQKPVAKPRPQTHQNAAQAGAPRKHSPFYSRRDKWRQFSAVGFRQYKELNEILTGDARAARRAKSAYQVRNRPQGRLAPAWDEAPYYMDRSEADADGNYVRQYLLDIYIEDGGSKSINKNKINTNKPDTSSPLTLEDLAAAHIWRRPRSTSLMQQISTLSDLHH